MSITIIAAIGNNGEIGLNGKLPWHCPAELEHFKRTVADMVTVCGAHTYYSLPLKLRNRTKVWSERTPNFIGVRDKRGNAIKFTLNINQVLELSKASQVAIIGGAETYAAFLPYADKAILSYIDGDFEADTFFPYHSMSGTADYSWVWHCLQERTTCPQSGLSFVVWEVTKQAVQP
jgi:dihydrofolate reductase